MSLEIRIEILHRKICNLLAPFSFESFDIIKKKQILVAAFRTEVELYVTLANGLQPLTDVTKWPFLEDARVLDPPV